MSRRFWMPMEISNLNYFLDPSKRVYWVFILSSIIIALVYLLLNPKHKKLNFSKALWLHPSALLDYYYFFISAIIKLMIVLPIVIGAKEVALMVNQLLIFLFGFTRVNSFSYLEVMLIFTFSLFLFNDFTRYWLHRLMHNIGWLWEFHKVHHSAKVLNPMTFYRVHPIENLLFGFRYSLSAGLVSGIFFYLFGSLINVYDILGVNAISYLFILLGSNLRHSHIPLSYPSTIENILISPRQHQIHHGRDHSNSNFGGFLAIWDKIFGTLAESKNIGTIKIGIDKKQMKNYKSISNILLFPFISIFRNSNKSSH